MRKTFFLFIVLSLVCPLSCTKDNSNSPNAPNSLTGKYNYEGKLNLMYGDQSETYNYGYIQADFDAGSISIKGLFEMKINISFDNHFTGVGSYTFLDIEDYGLNTLFSDKDQNEYTWENGSGILNITENTKDLIKGNFQFDVEDDAGDIKTVHGDFNMPVRDPAYPKLQGDYSYTVKLKIKCGSQSEIVQDGSIDVDTDSGTFSLSGGDKMSIDISFDNIYSIYVGKIDYLFSILEKRDLYTSCSDKDEKNYEWESGLSGSITITENTQTTMVGSYDFYGKGDSGTQHITGTFTTYF